MLSHSQVDSRDRHWCVSLEAYPATACIFVGSLLTLVFGVLNLIVAVARALSCPRFQARWTAVGYLLRGGEVDRRMGWEGASWALVLSTQEAGSAHVWRSKQT